jgi:hypothetical protein
MLSSSPAALPNNERIERCLKIPFLGQQADGSNTRRV